MIWMMIYVEIRKISEYERQDRMLIDSEEKDEPQPEESLLLDGDEPV